MKKKILLFTTIIFICLVVFLYIKICGRGHDLPLPDESPQKEYAIDKLPRLDNSSMELDEDRLALIVKLINLGVFGNIHNLIPEYCMRQ